jgi:hypothetical protein
LPGRIVDGFPVGAHYHFASVRDKLEFDAIASIDYGGRVGGIGGVGGGSFFGDGVGVEFGGGDNS